jgi:transcriptional regulator with XRE-family HTH domain
MSERIKRHELAKRLGVAPNTIYRWEKRGVSPVTPRKLKRTKEVDYAKEDEMTLRDWMNAVVEVPPGHVS